MLRNLLPRTRQRLALQKAKERTWRSLKAYEPYNRSLVKVIPLGSRHRLTIRLGGSSVSIAAVHSRGEGLFRTSPTECQDDFGTVDLTSTRARSIHEQYGRLVLWSVKIADLWSVSTGILGSAPTPTSKRSGEASVGSTTHRRPASGYRRPVFIRRALRQPRQPDHREPASPLRRSSATAATGRSCATPWPSPPSPSRRPVRGS